MGRSKTPEIVKIRQAIIHLSEEDFNDLIRDIDIIQEIREELHAKAVEAGEFTK